MKKAFRLSRFGAAVTALVLIFSAFIYTQAQTVTATPDSFVLQITSTTIPPTPTPTASPSPSPTATPGPVARDSFATDINGDGRFVVIESSGDIATERTATRNNADGNTEIFLYDYAQRRIFQITNTKSALKDATKSAADPTNIDVLVVNLTPVISHDGRFIVFSSNAYSDANAALSPLNFDGNVAANRTALKADGNTEIFYYEIPAVTAANLASGDEVPSVDLSAGTMTRVTATPASALPRAATANAPAFFADDNRVPQVNDDASFIAFVSQNNIANLGGTSNADGNEEIFIFNRTSPSFVQVTNTANIPGTPIGTRIFNDNPSLSGSGAVLAFISNADIGAAEAAADRGNAEVYVANFNGTVVSNLRQVTRTPPDRRVGFEGIGVNLLSPGRRLSRDGNLLAFESRVDFTSSGAVNGSLRNDQTIYIYNVTANTFTLVPSRPTGNEADINLRFPTFTGDSTRIVYSSTLNLRANGETAAAGAADGLNPTRNTQVFSAPVSAPTTISRLTRTPAQLQIIQPLPSDTIRRLAFGLRGTELGGGNADGSSEAYYVLIPQATSETPAPSPSPAPSPAPVSFFTGASERPVVSPSPQPSPPAVTALAPGMLGIMRSTLSLAPSNKTVSQTDAREDLRRPSLPVELNGVSVAISNAAAGLYFVSPGQINFVVPRGLIASTNALPVVINNNGAVIRTTLLLNSAQPDIFTTSNGPGGRAAVLNVTNPCIAPTSEPFAVTTTRPSGAGSGTCTGTTTETVPTELLIMLTGVRNATPSQVTVRIKDTDLTGAAILSVGPSLTAGFDQIVVRLPASLAGAGDSPIIVTVQAAVGGAVTSRPADTAPRITIQ